MQLISKSNERERSRKFDIVLSKLQFPLSSEKELRTRRTNITVLIVIR